MQSHYQIPTPHLEDMEESTQNAHSQNEFAHRHIGPNDDDVAVMLALLGLTSLEELIAQTVPAGISSSSLKNLKEPLSEAETLRELGKISGKNQLFRSFIGQGYYDCFTPSVILRNVLENPAWYTSYTPYQPEISQGRLEALLNFQTMVCDLTCMEIANASMLDEATAAAEAMMMCLRLSKAKIGTFLVACDCLPQTIDVLYTRAEPLNIKIRVVEQDELAKALSTSQEGDEIVGILLQYPGVDGEVRDLAKIVSLAHEKGAHVSVAADLLALTLLKPPGEWGADIVVGSTQRFGVPMGYGGPHAAYLATRDVFKREMPGRLVGVSVDSHGHPANRLALQTREQHIRREKATSNICTAQALLAIMASFYAVYHGPKGLGKIAKRIHDLTTVLASGLKSLGYKVVTREFFDTLLVESGKHTSFIHQKSRQEKINLRVVDDKHLGISLDETTGVREVQQLLSLFAQHAPTSVDVSSLIKTTSFLTNSFSDNLARTSTFLTHPVFNSYQSETEMMRYLRGLADRDLALDRTMIPLGSCTMKLNAATEMMPVSWPTFANMHPFVPAEQARGYQELAHDLEKMLCECTGYDEVSLQPNSGAQGEYAGLLAIRAYHATRNEAQRNICLIPASAHGTNPASAHMAGMQVVVVACDTKGNVDLNDLATKAAKHSGHLAAMMITYPSTHGVFESHVQQMCDIVHANGGQVYIDGANLNAQVGLAKPGEYGGDVSHLNLHKTFCIPHGGGGPGVGPIGVKSHLAPFLPGRRKVRGGGIVSAAALGSAGILPISWSYIRMMGGEGLRRASTIAIVNANYIAARLSPHYPILYTDEKGRVAHECIIDLRPITQKTGITGEDVAKRLIDFGFHAPTMSFPVLGTLMIEPTESESLGELDRFCQAMLKIKEEIDDVENGKLDANDNPLKNAPHTAESLVGEWHHAYSRAQAVFPVENLRRHKYWPPVGRIDNVYGDRNLFCTCLPMSEVEVNPS